jgi:hypothetical protein
MSDTKLAKKAKNLVATKQAEQEFADFAEAMDIDVDVESMSMEDLDSFKAPKKRIIRAIENGSLTFNDLNEAVYTPRKSTYQQPITFHERTGGTLLAMDRAKGGQDGHKAYAAMGDLCGLPAKTFSNLIGIDIKVCEALFALLMGG